MTTGTTTAVGPAGGGGGGLPATHAELVWVQTCILDTYHCHRIHNHDNHQNSNFNHKSNSLASPLSSATAPLKTSIRKSPLLNSSSSVDVTSTSAITMTGEDGWGWVLGYATMVPSVCPSSSASTLPHGKTGTTLSSSPLWNHTNTKSTHTNTNTNTNTTSPYGGQVKLRKTLSTIDSPTPSVKLVSPQKNSNDPPRLITIQDEYNTIYNGRTFQLSAQEFMNHVLPANSTPVKSVETIVPSTNHCDPSSPSHTWMESLITPTNLIELTHLHEPALLHSLRVRFAQNKVYTFCGKILIALNPFSPMPHLYGDHIMHTYRQTPSLTTRQDRTTHASLVSESLEPHIYAITDSAFRVMQTAMANVIHSRNISHSLGNNGKQNIPSTWTTTVVDQSILISGESGAGKTYNTKIVMRYLASLSQQALQKSQTQGGHLGTPPTSTSTTTRITATSGMEQQVLQSNPILESFGNARTLRNDNSSRFGKFIEIKFNQAGCIVGAAINTYLLEKVRLVRQTEGERNYHIFYELLHGLPTNSSERRQLGLYNRGVRDFKITAMSNTYDRRDGVKDSHTYKELLHAFHTVGFSSAEQYDLMRVVSGLLHMSNLTFVESESAAEASVLDTSNTSLPYVLELFGVDAEALTSALCKCTIVVRGETMAKNLNMERAEKAKEAFMKATYGALFDYIVSRVNGSTAAGTSDEHDSRSKNDFFHIRILDIFGFESFATNSFEQLCINYCNEALQQQFNRFVFKMEQLEYEREGIEWSFISFPDNQDVLDLIEKKHVGIFSILDEQCKLAKCTDQTFASVTYEKCSDHPRFSSDRRQQASGLFQISHYAGSVEYSTASFLEKNKNELPKETTDFLISSRTQILCSLGKLLNEKGETIQSDRIRNAPSSSKSVGGQFTMQLRELREQIDATNPHYVRCLKPNDELVPRKFVAANVADQLRCAGVLEAIRVSRLGFPQRYNHESFVQRYGLLAPSVLSKSMKHSCASNQCEALLRALVHSLLPPSKLSTNKQSSSSYLISLGIQIGKSKVFLRQNAFDQLENLRFNKLSSCATLIQTSFRMWLFRCLYYRLRSATITIQKTYRMYMAKKAIYFRRREMSSLKIQTFWRGYVKYTEYSMIIFVTEWCQRTYRGNKARELTLRMQLQRNAIKLQAWFRMITSHRRFLRIHFIALSTQRLFRCRVAKRALKNLKIESRSLNRITKERDDIKNELARMRQELEDSRCKALEETKAALEEAKRRCEEEAKVLIEEARRQAVAEAIRSLETSRSSYSKHSDILVPPGTEKQDLLREKTCNAIVAQLVTQKALHDVANSCSFSSSASKVIGNESFNYSTKTYTAKETSISIRDRVTLTGESKDSLSTNQFQDGYAVCAATPNDTTVHDISLLDSEDPCAVVESEGSYPTTADDPYLEEMSYVYSINFETAIHLAVRASDDDALSVAITTSDDLIFDINKGGHGGKTPLHIAVLNSKIKTVEFLLKNNSVANSQDDCGNTPLHYAASFEMMTLLIERGLANPNIPNNSGWCALHLAVQRHDVDSVRLLLRHNVNVNSCDYDRWLTPMHLLMQTDLVTEEDLEIRMKIARLLCDVRSIALDEQDKDGNTPLHYATISFYEDVKNLLILLLRRGANPNIVNNRGQTALHLLLHNRKLCSLDFYHDTLSNLLDHGADVNIATHTGCTPLHLALYHREMKFAVEIVSRGGQLQVPWKKPTSWETHWRDTGSVEVYCLDMVEDLEDLRQLIHSVKSNQVAAPRRSICMHCKVKFRGISKQLTCRLCGSTVCSSCASRKFESYRLPSYCNNGSSSKMELVVICKICEEILAVKNRDDSLMGKEIYALSESEDVSILDSDCGYQENISQSVTVRVPVKLDVDV